VRGLKNSVASRGLPSGMIFLFKDLAAMEKAMLLTMPDLKEVDSMRVYLGIRLGFSIG
jgi:hypothetical protein